VNLIPLAVIASLAAFPVLAQSTVPFVGCPMDGQQGPIEAPVRPLDIPPVSDGVAGRLAYYASGNIGVLAPRGWSCLGLLGQTAIGSM
jgi:hypothetical protein